MEKCNHVGGSEKTVRGSERAAARGRVVEVNWRAVHLETGAGTQITPNSVLAGASFTNLSRPADAHSITVTTIFSLDDPPNQVCALLTRLAADLPMRRPDGTVSATQRSAQSNSALWSRFAWRRGGSLNDRCCSLLRPRRCAGWASRCRRTIATRIASAPSASDAVAGG